METRSLRWTSSQDEMVIEYHTSYLNKAFEMKLLNYKTTIEETSRRLKSLTTIDTEERDKDKIKLP